ncbi:MAG: glutathione S-transferase [Myxococcales bacterium]|nr:glutathione S-transferase [Myxococcales bacterium]
MIQLVGFSMSNYHSVVLMYLLEKGIPFEERLDDIVLADDISAAGDEVLKQRLGDYLRKSPVGKVPCIVTPEGNLSETQIILDYLEEAHPDVPLLPNAPFARAKARELVRVLDLHIELVMRRLYPEAFFGGNVGAEVRAEVHELLIKGINGLNRLTTLSPYAFGDTFTLVDCVAGVHLPILQAVMAEVYRERLGLLIPNLERYLEKIGQRPSHATATATIRQQMVELGVLPSSMAS